MPLLTPFTPTLSPTKVLRPDEEMHEVRRAVCARVCSGTILLHRNGRVWPRIGLRVRYGQGLGSGFRALGRILVFFHIPVLLIAFPCRIFVRLILHFFLCLCFFYLFIFFLILCICFFPLFIFFYLFVHLFFSFVYAFLFVYAFVFFFFIYFLFVYAYVFINLCIYLFFHLFRPIYITVIIIIFTEIMIMIVIIMIRP